MRPAGVQFVNAIERRDLKAARDVLKPLSVLDTPVAARDAGTSNAFAKIAAAFCADIQGQRLKAVRAPTANPLPAAAPVQAKATPTGPAPRTPGEAPAWVRRVWFSPLLNRFPRPPER